MSKPLLAFSLAAALGFASASLSASAPASPAWEKIPGAAHQAAVREARLRIALAPLSIEQTEQALKRLVADEISSASMADFLVATEVLAAKAGARALSFAQDHRARDVSDRSLRDAFVRGWSQVDLEAAAAWLASTAKTGWDDDETVELARVILKTHARRDPPAAMARALRYAAAEPSRRETFVLAVIEELVYHGRFEQARALTDAIADVEMRSAVQADLLGVVAEHQPALASAWFQELPSNQHRAGVVFRLVEAWSARSLAEAVTFFERLEPAERSIDLVESMLVNASNPRPDVVERLADEFSTGPELDRLLVAALNRINLLSSSDIPWQWFTRFTSTRTRDQTLASLLVQRFHRDPPAAKAVVDRLDFLTPGQREQLLAAVARNHPAGRHQNQPTP